MTDQEVLLPFMLVVIIVCLSQYNVEAKKSYTPLIPNYRFACAAENLKRTSKYFCDAYGRVRCTPGWSQPHTLCQVPVCTINNRTCIHGECSKPFTCDCDIGWMGQFCEKCIVLPGCVNGYCNHSLECKCKPGWAGMLCDKPKCPGCVHGACVAPGKCVCHPGWMGENCSTCQTRMGCNYGQCVDKPFQCKCYDDYEGFSCDKPKCSEGCHPDHGYCDVPETCICKAGWAGHNCTECVPYWNCKHGKCINNPWECICDPGYVGKDCRVYGHVDGNWGDWGTWGDCSVSCGYGVKMRTRKCNTPSPAGKGKYCSHDGSSSKDKMECYKSECPSTTAKPTTTSYYKGYKTTTPISTTTHHTPTTRKTTPYYVPTTTPAITTTYYPLPTTTTSPTTTYSLPTTTYYTPTTETTTPYYISTTTPEFTTTYHPPPTTTTSPLTTYYPSTTTTRETTTTTEMTTYYVPTTSTTTPKETTTYYLPTTTTTPPTPKPTTTTPPNPKPTTTTTPKKTTSYHPPTTTTQEEYGYYDEGSGSFPFNFFRARDSNGQIIIHKSDPNLVVSPKVLDLNDN